jgi:GntR family transcriptional regulator, arabinose operon transcriptional repressor
VLPKRKTIVSGLDRGHVVALYTQLIAHFRERILDGSLPAGSRLPGELELAQLHNVSRGTVRQAMTALVNEGLVERIQGRGTFVRSLAATSAPGVQSRSGEKRIGLLLSYPSSELDLDILVGVEQAARSRGYQVSFAYTEESAEEQTRDIHWLLADHVLGLIIYPLSNLDYDESIWQLQADDIPFVLIDRYFPNLDTDYVISDNVGGGYRATEHLIILGHTRIGFLYSYTGSLLTTSVRDRHEGYRKALREYGLPYDESLILKVPQLPKDGLRNLHEELLRRADRPTAVFTSVQYEAVALMQSAQQMGMRIPDDLAVVGFDDTRLTSHVYPPLTTVAQPCQDIGLRATNLLINRIEGQVGAPQHIELPTSLIIRESCGARLHVRNLPRGAKAVP